MAALLAPPIAKYLERRMNLSRGTISRILQSGGPFLGLLLVCVLALTEERSFHLPSGNFKNILVQTVIVAVGLSG